MNLDLARRFEAFYRNFGAADLAELDCLYHPNLVFVDPIHRLEGLAGLTAYFEESRANVTHCAFEFNDRALQDNRGFFQWRMHFAHPRLERGKPQILRGCSLIKCNEGKIVYHEDFYDLGAMLYEHLPILGWVTRKIKRNLASE